LQSFFAQSTFTLQSLTKQYFMKRGPANEVGGRRVTKKQHIPSSVRLGMRIRILPLSLALSHKGRGDYPACTLKGASDRKQEGLVGKDMIISLKTDAETF
jgi:hypothetical protein